MGRRRPPQRVPAGAIGGIVTPAAPTPPPPTEAAIHTAQAGDIATDEKKAAVVGAITPPAVNDAPKTRPGAPSVVGKGGSDVGGRRRSTPRPIPVMKVVTARSIGRIPIRKVHPLRPPVRSRFLDWSIMQATAAKGRLGGVDGRTKGPPHSPPPPSAPMAIRPIRMGSPPPPRRRRRFPWEIVMPPSPSRSILATR